MLDRDYLDTTQAGSSNCFVNPALSRTFGVPELQTPRCYCSTGLTLLAAAKCLLPHTDSIEPVHPPPLSSDPAPAPYYHPLLHIPVLEAFVLTALCAHSLQTPHTLHINCSELYLQAAATEHCSLKPAATETVSSPRLFLC
ncbi:hypothetical protein ATANTOWER_032323 [Ataeniobius toweri]|uniref:Uncharacterized protein n=1 Tax=Ataeniobius toweri TaxID=208326 RepID=A0ABU7ARQ3_9TELE|nr:hypothetical protein [Ataeniobius toweri]